MRELPSGTVTFVFTDVEGSTNLLRSLGRERFAETLRLHHKLLREAWAAHGGYEVDTAGDGFLVAFGHASTALDAAAQAQCALAAAPWPSEDAVRIRIGVHTGEAALEDGRYIGVSVHRAARICAVGHGGQIVVSQSAVDLCRDERPGITLRALGLHRLKDFPEPQPLYQLEAPGLEQVFPPLRSLSNTNLPRPAFPLLGREHELARVRELMLEEERRLVTVTGAGGTGKTRFALEVALGVLDDFPDGVLFVPLAAVADSARVPAAVVDSLRLREQPGRSLVDTLREHLVGKRILLLVDNVEHVIDASPLFADLLDAAPRLAVLATSREPLRLAVECEFPLDPLDDGAAAELFITRARDSVPDFDGDVNRGAVVEICRRVDGLPLALELAAARVKLLGVDGLLAALERRLDVLRGLRRDAPARQRTLRATIEWSYDLLDADEQRVLSELAVFVEGCTLDAAAVVCRTDIDVVGSLLDKGLVRRREADGELRFWLLQTIREFALELLEAEGAPVRDRHLVFYAGLAERAAPELWRADQLPWLRRLDREHDNFHAALRYALLEGGDVEAGARLAAALQDYWDVRGNYREGELWLTEALRRRDELSPYAAASAMTGAAVMVARQGKTAMVVPLLTEASEIFRALGRPAEETRAIGMVAPWLAGGPDPEARERGADAAARAQAAAEEADDDVARFLAYSAAAEVAAFVDPREARPLLEHAREMCGRTGDRRNEAITLTNLAEATAGDDPAFAESCLEASASIAREVDDPRSLAGSLATLAGLRLDGRRGDALPPLREAVRLARDHGIAAAANDCLLPCVALVAVEAGDAAAAAQLLAAFEQIASVPTYTPPSRTTNEIIARIQALLANSADEGELETARASGGALTPDAALEVAAAALDILVHTRTA
jgi:predicted ATPase/class 3 adenylate cyclase